MSINNFLGITSLPRQVQSLFLKYLVLRLSISFTLNLSSTFYILFAIDTIGFELAAVMASLMLLSQLMFDYPSGSLGDWIGQRWVLTTALLSFSFGYCLLTLAHDVFTFLLIGLIFGFANAQFSGTMETWLVNNYQLAIGEGDPKRTFYGFAQSRIATLENFALASAFLSGGALATLLFRQSVFFIQFILILFVIGLVLSFVKE